MIDVNHLSPRAATPENPTEQPQPTEQPPTDVHSSPPKRNNNPTINQGNREEWSEHVYPRHHTEIQPQEMISKLVEKKPLDSNWELKIRTNWENGQQVAALNKISDSIRQNIKAGYLIHFIETGSVPPGGHPTGLKSRPDFVAYKKYQNDPARGPTPPWSHLEATGELRSKGKSIGQSQAQEAAYAAYHLQARPDLVSVAGMWIKEKQFNIFFVNACRVYITSTVQLEHEVAKELLYAFVWYLYHPQLDETISIDTRVTPPTFSIKLIDGHILSDLKLTFTGSVPGRRTTVYMKSSGLETSHVIKEQYIEEHRRFSEADLLKKIHSKGEFPGVVRIDAHELRDDVTASHDDSTRSKTRLVLKDMGKPLQEVKEVRELLMALYDFLEITRMLHNTFKIYHRDLSPGNLLVTENPRPFDEKTIKLESMGFSHCLLESADHAPQSGHHNITLEERTRTRALLTDFDSGEERAPSKEPQTKSPMPRTGTPAFMAHVVRNLQYPGGNFKFLPMPPVCSTLLPRYQALHPGRVMQFLENEKLGETLFEIEDKTLPPEEFKHLLRYDAESVFWILLYWSILAQPATCIEQTKSLIPSVAWQSLTGLDDVRYDNYVNSSRRFPLHPEYLPMSNLLNNMRQHLKVDLKFAKDKVRRENPEYLHEVFQRLILNFMADPNNLDFLKLEKDVQDREKEPVISGGGSEAKLTQKSSKYSSAQSLSQTQSKTRTPASAHATPTIPVEDSNGYTIPSSVSGDRPVTPHGPRPVISSSGSNGGVETGSRGRGPFAVALAQLQADSTKPAPTTDGPVTRSTAKLKQGDNKSLSSSPGGSNMEAGGHTSRADAKRARPSSSNLSKGHSSSEEGSKSKRPRRR